MLRSQQSGSDLYMEELSGKEIHSDGDGDFFPFDYSTLSFDKMYIGIGREGKDKTAFHGSIKDIKLISSYWSDKSQIR